MVRGRKKLPQELLDLRGTARKDRARPSCATEAKIQKFGIECTNFAGYRTMTDRAKAIFAKACKDCIAIRILTPAFLPQLSLYARELDIYLSCMEDIQANGRYLINTNGKTGAVTYADNPSFRQANQALVQIRALGSNFGFSPVDAMKLKVQEQLDPLERVKSMMLSVEYDGPDNQ